MTDCRKKYFDNDSFVCVCSKHYCDEPGIIPNPKVILRPSNQQKSEPIGVILASESSSNFKKTNAEKIKDISSFISITSSRNKDRFKIEKGTFDFYQSNGM